MDVRDREWISGEIKEVHREFQARSSEFSSKVDDKFEKILANMGDIGHKVGEVREQLVRQNGQVEMAFERAAQAEKKAGTADQKADEAHRRISSLVRAVLIVLFGAVASGALAVLIPKLLP